MPTIAFDEKLLARSTSVEFLLDEFAKRAADGHTDQDVDRDRGNDDQRQAPRISEENRDEHKSKNDIKRREKPWPVRNARIVSSSRTLATV